MKLSYDWLQSYFSKPLPTVSDIERVISLHAFEHEETEEHANGDMMIEFDVLPNRAADCLSHYGMAKEIAIHFDRDDFIDDWRERIGVEGVPTATNSEGVISRDKNLAISVENYEKCTGYMACVMKDIKKDSSPDWVQKRLETIGQRSIHNLVDATNYVMFELGQPLHVFDYAKIAKNNDGVPEIIVRDAKMGETMTTLDNKELEFTGGELVIADPDKILALAGVKGGKAAEVDDTTTDVVLECAHFDANMVRRMRRKFNMLTDASKRYENRLSPWVKGEAIQMLSSLMYNIAGSEKTEIMPELRAIDPNIRERFSPKEVQVSHAQIEALLGISLEKHVVRDILNTLSIKIKDTTDDFYVLESPLRRRDLNITEDFIEEIGRIHGYDKIPPQDLSDINFTPKTLQITTCEQQLRIFLSEKGFSELMGYTFEEKGDIEVLKAMASDKNFLRTNLLNQAEHAMKQNLYFAPLYNRNEIMTFELGRVFPGGNEERHLVISLAYTSKKAKKAGGPTGDRINVIIDALEKELGVTIKERAQSNDGHLEVRYDDWVSDTLDGVIANEESDDAKSLSNILGTYDIDNNHLHVFTPYSMYPFMTRDIALWVDATVSSDEIIDLIKENAGDLALRIDQFDRFEKEGRVSYAFRIIFQSMDKTLEESDITPIMKALEEKIKEKGWEVR